MAFDGIVTKSVIFELNNHIIDGKINKVFEPNKNEVVLGIYSNGKNYALNMCIDSNNCRIHLTTHSKPNPLNAHNFCMLLRKHIIGFRIKKIYNYDLERVITLDLEGYDELNDLTSKKLVIELMGKHSNILLLNNRGFIIDSLRHFDSSSHSQREILPAREYIYPECTKQSIVNLNNFEEFYSIMQNSTFKSFDKILSSNFIGISMGFIQYVLKKLSINNEDLNKENMKIIYNYIRNIVDNINSSNISCIEFLNSRNHKDYIIDYYLKESDLQVNFFIDDFYNSKEINENFTNYRNNILKLILITLNKYKARLKNINEKLLECDNRFKYQLYGELITTNLYKIKNQNLSKITLENYYDNNKPITIPLDNTISVPNNAKKYFKKYNKLKTALEIATSQKKQTEAELKYIESIIYELENCNNIEEINDVYTEISESNLFKDNLSSNKRNKKSTNKDSIFTPLEYNIDGFTVLVGKNNKQNDYLTTKIAHNSDIWFHTKDIHGSHVILHSEGKDINHSTLVKCAQIAAYYSKGKLSSNVPVDYCYVRYVKKPSGSKPGMVIYTNNKTLYVNPKV